MHGRKAAGTGGGRGAERDVKDHGPKGNDRAHELVDCWFLPPGGTRCREVSCSERSTPPLPLLPFPEAITATLTLSRNWRNRQHSSCCFERDRCTIFSVFVVLPWVFRCYCATPGAGDRPACCSGRLRAEAAGGDAGEGGHGGAEEKQASGHPRGVRAAAGQQEGQASERRCKGLCACMPPRCFCFLCVGGGRVWGGVSCAVSVCLLFETAHVTRLPLINIPQCGGFSQHRKAIICVMCSVPCAM